MPLKRTAIDRRDLAARIFNIPAAPSTVVAGPQVLQRGTAINFPSLKPTPSIFITERDIADLDSRGDNIDLLIKLGIFDSRGRLVIQRAPIAPAVIPKVRSRPASIPGAGLLPSPTTVKGDADMATFFESLGDVAIDVARQEFLSTGGTSQAGTVVEFPTTFVPQIGTDNGFVAAPRAKRRRRRRRLLTASDKCDIAAMKAMLNTNEFKIWLACPSMFKG